MTNAQQMQKLLVLAEKQVKEFDRLPAKKKAIQAKKHLKAAGILTAKGKLAAAFA